MSTHATATQERTDPRPTYLPLGVDKRDGHHVYHTAAERVIVVRDGERKLVQDLGDKKVDEWMGYVDAKRGWYSRQYYRSLADHLAASIEETH